MGVREMTLREACQILADIHTRPSRDYGVIVQISAPVPRGTEERYIQAWATVASAAVALETDAIVARKLFTALDQMVQLSTTYGDGFSATERIRREAKAAIAEAKARAPHLTEFIEIINRPAVTGK